MTDYTPDEREIQLLEMWMGYTREKREEQLDEMRIILQRLTDESAPAEKVEKFRAIVEMLEDWHRELV